MGLLLDMEADPGFGRRRGRFEQGAELLADVLQRRVVQEQGLVAVLGEGQRRVLGVLSSARL